MEVEVEMDRNTRDLMEKAAGFIDLETPYANAVRRRAATFSASALNKLETDHRTLSKLTWGVSVGRMGKEPLPPKNKYSRFIISMNRATL